MLLPGRGSVTTLEGVVETLQEAEIQFAVIGASGMAVHGVLRSTLDIDLLTTNRRVLQKRMWDRLVNGGFEVDIRLGDISDPLVGVVTVSVDADRPVDLIVGEAPWQERIIEEAAPGFVAGMDLPGASLVGLILLKLYAGGPQDCWDIKQLRRRAGNPESVEREISERVLNLPVRARRLWEDLAAV